MSLIIDSHCDLAWNMLNFGRDYTRSAAETRAKEKGTQVPGQNGDSLIGWPDYQRGQVAVVFSTLFASPLRFRLEDWEKLYYSTYDQAHRLYMDELQLYHQLAESQPDSFRLIFNARDLRQHLAEWGDESKKERPVGLVVLMEGADGIRGVDELSEWYDLGLRLIGLAWAGTAAVLIGWPLVTVFVLTIAASMAEIASAYPTAGGLYYWASKMKNKDWGWWTAWFNLIGQFAIVAGINFAAAFFLNQTIITPLTGGSYTNTTEILSLGDTLVISGQLLTMAILMAVQLVLNIVGINVVAWLNQVSVWWHIIGVLLIVLLVIVILKVADREVIVR